MNKKELTYYIPSEIVNKNPNKNRIILINHLKNGGVGSAIARGYKWCKDHNIDCTAVMAGDGQMDPNELKRKLKEADKTIALLRDELDETNRGLVALTMDLEEKVAERTRELSELNAKLEQRVSERTSLLQHANAELESFSYSVSHDLRAPLRSIDGFSLALLEDCYDVLDEQGKDFLERIRKATKHMSQLIDDMLILSRITRYEIHCSNLDLSRIVRDITERLKTENPGRSVEVRIECTVFAFADERLMRIALTNLIENAWKYTSKSNNPAIEFGTVNEQGTRRDHSYDKAYFIRDNGVGFDMRFKNKLFLPFQRLHSASEFKGTGVGLATVQRIIQRHAGTIWAESEPEKGAVFYFTLNNTTGM